MKDNWKNEEVFKKQLELNVQQLIDKPAHWLDFAKCLDRIRPKSILDVGCGSGVYSQLCTGIEYIGLDYSKEAVDVATEHWGLNCFSQMDLWELVPDFTNEFDCLHFGALLDVLPNAKEALQFILNLNHRAVILGRVRTTTKDDHVIPYVAYDLIETVAYYHNQYQFVEMIRDHGYEYDVFGTTWLLRSRIESF
jgi:2-polyprenyl-3-methyl-5-hydroxy-6-metoxy-1,4-benzoquinol methylase